MLALLKGDDELLAHEQAFLRDAEGLGPGVEIYAFDDDDHAVVKLCIQGAARRIEHVVEQVVIESEAVRNLPHKRTVVHADDPDPEHLPFPRRRRACCARGPSGFNERSVAEEDALDTEGVRSG